MGGTLPARVGYGKNSASYRQAAEFFVASKNFYHW